ncbi:lytic transglycosylase domain-containing protein [Belnapia sp. F-4-1]|uniref:lytic transglycosylase domain-containing protein n=1 Tax=Belnapia sp. F-4-1 TaxID=1545443 RepID=UPI001186C92F|nr:lytic transglycosylase domain-containing protein [Belnapia sp. F-4-1]
MPEGNRTSRDGMAGGTGRVARLAQPAMALSVLAMLAACGQQQATRPSTGHHVAVTHGSYNRPASYNPPGPPGDPWGPYIRQAARRFDVPERWIREVMRQESGGRSSATSPVGAMGLMQVMPGTYRELQARYGLGDDPYHPYDSVMAGAAYIREMYDLYGSPAFLAAYNAGPRRLEDYLWNSRGLPAETRNYVARIGPNIVAHHPSRRAAPEIYAAAEIPLSIPAGPRRMDQATMIALREQRQAVDPGVQVAQLPAGPVVRMEPIPDGSTYAAPAAPPVQLASLDTSSVVRMDPIPDGSTAEGAQRLMASEARAAESLAAPPAPPAARRDPGFAAPVARAQASASAAPRPSVLASANTASASRPAARGFALQPGPAPSQPALLQGFGGMVSTAHASSLPVSLRPGAARAATTGAWAVQVGAFASENLARSAANAAREAGGGQAQVQPVAAGRGKLYRARVTGLSQGSAQSVCERLRRSGACMVLSPDAQS